MPPRAQEVCDIRINHGFERHRSSAILCRTSTIVSLVKVVSGQEYLRDMIFPVGFADSECYAKELAAFVNSPIFQLLTVEIHHLDSFLTGTPNDPWQKLPSEWRAWFEDDCEDIERLEMRLRDVRMKGTSNLLNRPKTLDDFLARLRGLALPRLRRESRSTFSQPHIAELSPDLLRGMSIKKQVEVIEFAGIVQSLANRVGAENAIDIGAGFGPLQVLAVDGSRSQIEGSIALSGSSASTTLEPSITYLLQHVSSASSGRVEVECWLKKKGPAVIVGLHCCGSLTDDLLGMFLQTETIRGVAVAGCCFNHLRTSATPAESCIGQDSVDVEPSASTFPSSSLLKSYSLRLSSTAKMAACQNVGGWTDSTGRELSEKERKKEEQNQLLSRKRKHYRRLFTRLLLSSHLLQESRPQLETLRLGSIPRNKLSSFTPYASYVLSKLDLLTEENNGSLMEEAKLIEETYSGWRWDARGRTIEALGKAIGEVVESTIAIDRYLTLKTHHAVDPETVDIFQTWAYEDSPRNLILVAQKRPL
ncbi:rRNA adenine N-6-methyltransferase [Phaffia rhodozyma]|uniref:rRNA adenine N-6-methyltransferase n=1 Tax=Phaffia rhodozyma TaxID=264483 RepID=A0A0F7SFC9_PHARH|nr:rRNA adenine N-6-methyltransferase [Phaffia rhodozyma]